MGLKSKTLGIADGLSLQSRTYSTGHPGSSSKNTHIAHTSPAFNTSQGPHVRQSRRTLFKIYFTSLAHRTMLCETSFLLFVSVSARNCRLISAIAESQVDGLTAEKAGQCSVYVSSRRQRDFSLEPCCPNDPSLNGQQQRRRTWTIPPLHALSSLWYRPPLTCLDG